MNRYLSDKEWLRHITFRPEKQGVRKSFRHQSTESAFLWTRRCEKDLYRKKGDRGNQYPLYESDTR